MPPLERLAKMCVVLIVAFLIAVLFLCAINEGVFPTPHARRAKHRRGKNGGENSEGGSSWKRWYRYERCRLVESGKWRHRNDGDSFQVHCDDIHRDTVKEGTITKKLQNRELRLYYVDTPESAFKTYGHPNQNNGRRLADQAAYFGFPDFDAGTENDDTGIIGGRNKISFYGKEAKSYARARLAGSPAAKGTIFTVHTLHELVYGDPDRVYGLVEFVEGGNSNSTWLHRELVQRGLARLDKTKPPPTQLQHLERADEREALRALEAEAVERGRGAWGAWKNPRTAPRAGELERNQDQEREL
eukprot:g4809.t1